MNRALPPGIAEIERLLGAGHPDVEGLCLALLDWSGELQLIQGVNRLRDVPKK